MSYLRLQRESEEVANRRLNRDYVQLSRTIVRSICRSANTGSLRMSVQPKSASSCKCLPMIFCYLHLIPRSAVAGTATWYFRIPACPSVKQQRLSQIQDHCTAYRARNTWPRLILSLSILPKFVEVSKIFRGHALARLWPSQGPRLST